MKIDDLVKANELATKWRYLVQLERTLRDAPWLAVTALSIPSNLSGGVDLADLYHAGLDSKMLNEQIRDLVAEMLDRQASLILSEMEKIGLHTTELAEDREEMIRVADEKEKQRRAG